VKQLTIGGVVCLLLCAGGTRVEAQEVAPSFDQLAVLVKPGDTICQKPAGRSRVNGSPVFGHGRRGAAVTVTF
jgi:hypothetical protein